MTSESGISKKDYIEEDCMFCKFYKDSQCRRFPPQVVTYIEINDSYTCTEFPQMAPNEWCGEYKRKELPQE